MSQAQLLIAEENSALAEFAKLSLQEVGFSCQTCHDTASLASHREGYRNFLVSVDLPEETGLQAARAIWQHDPAARVVFWADRIAETCVRHALEFVPEETVFGYIQKSIAQEGLQHACEQVFREEQCFLQMGVSDVVARLQDPNLGLTHQEYEVLVDIALGLTDRAIAERRFLSRRGVTNRLNSVYRKLQLAQDESSKWGHTYNLRNRAIRVAMQRGVITEALLEQEEVQWREFRASDRS